MKSMRRLFGAALILSTTISSYLPSAYGAEGKGAASPSKSYDVTQFDIMNVRLGMTPEQVHAALVGSEYQLKSKADGFDFLGRVKFEAMSRQRLPTLREHFTSALKEEIYSGPASQTLRISYMVTKTGPIVKQAEYRVQNSYMDWTQLAPVIRAKYGAPSESDGFNVADYCTLSAGKCSYSAPYMKVIRVMPFEYYSSISLFQGSLADDRYRQSVDAAVDASMPKVDRPGF